MNNQIVSGRTRAFLLQLVVLVLASWMLPADSLAAPIAYIQGNYATPQSLQSTVAVSFRAAQTAGNLNAVVVGWNDTTATVSSVTDSAGNVYSLAIGPTSGTGLRQSIYYAANIKAGANTVSVQFSQAAQFPDIRILEYQGVSAVDVAVGGSGSSGTSSSGTATTTSANDLLLGANMVATLTTGAGAGFVSRIISSPDGDIAEDRVVTSTGSYSATAPVSPSGVWVMQMVAFKASATPAPTVTSVSPNSGTISGGTGVTITGTNFVSGATVTLGGTAATNVVVVSGTQITATTPAHAAGAVTVTVTNADTQSGSLTNGYTYVGPAPTVTSVSPTSGTGSGGTSITITGTNFVSGATVTLGGTAATNVVVVSGTQITATTPAHAAGAVTVTVTNADTQSGSLANGYTYLAPAPTVTSVSPNSGTISGGTGVTITGTNFVSGATVTLGGTAATNVVVVSGTQITATTPAHAAGAVTVTVTNADTQSGSLTNGYTYVGPAPTVTSVSPTSGTGSGGTSITITGTNFVSGATVTLGGTAATNVLVVSGTQITATTPAHAAGAVTVTVTNPDTQSTSLPNGYTYTTSVAIGFGQVAAATPQSVIQVVTVAYPGAQTAGDLNVVVVGWNDATATVSSVTDSAGNVYNLAIGPTSGTALRQSIYYAANIKSGSNTVTVTFNQAAQFPDIRILEYRGVSAVDVTVGASGSGTTAATGNATTTSTNELIFGAATVAKAVNGAGAGFTSRIITNPDRDNAEDRVVTAMGTYSATAPLSGTGPWVMQTVTFSTQKVVDIQPPTAPSNLTATASSSSQIGLSWTASTDNVGVTQYFVERCQGSGCTNFSQIGTSTGTTYTDSGLISSTSYSYRARAADAAGNLSPYSNVASASTQSSDTQPPTAPTNLTATAASGAQINLAWSASTDNVGVTGYVVERCQGAGCSSFVQIAVVGSTTYSDTGLSINTSYTYRAKATDAAGNFSPYSNTATAVTLNTIPGLVAAYSFDEGAGTTVTDFSGNGNTGTLTNTTWTTSAKYGNALVFNGTSSMITTADSASLHLTTAMTLEAWVNPSVITNAWRDIVYKGNDKYFLSGTSNLGTPAGGVTLSSGEVVTRASSTLATSTWSHLALTYDGSSLRLYVNGVQVSSLANAGTITTSTNPLQIGGDSIFGQFFAGTIDEVRVYNTALSQSQIQVDMQTPIGSGGSLALVTFSVPSINFGNVATGSSSSPQSVTMTNVGGALLTIGSLAISGGSSGDFTQTNNCGISLAPGSSCAINVTFTPTTTGSRSSTVSITDNAPGSPQTIPVTGTGIGFSITPRVAALTFTRTQQFSASSGSVTWSVDGIVGGSVASGTITATGLYSPPSSVGTHLVTATTTTQSAMATVYITNYPGTFTHHNDNLRTGQNTSETVLTTALINQAQFGKIGTYTLDGIAFASPLYVANVSIPAQGFHNVVYVATEHDSVYAWDADGLSASPLWQVSFLKSGVTPVPCADTGECGDIPNEIGITGTPVIDPNSGTLYVVAKTKEGGKYVQRLHALDVTTGAEKFGGPVQIQASVAGSGDGSQGGQLSFDPLRENQRPALLLSNGVVYVGWASHGDQIPWHGWILGYNATSLQQVMTYCVSPDGSGGGVWASGGGIGADASGSLFFNTGNGDFNADTGGRDYGDTVVKLGTTGSVIDYFTPFDQAIMDAQDLDLASAGPVLLVDQPGTFPHLLITAAKGGSIYVVNRDYMGHFHSGDDSQIVQSLVSILPHGNLEEGNFSAPAFFNGYVYFAAVNDNLKAFQLTNGSLSVGPTSQTADVYPNRGGAFAASGNGNTNGILWALQDNTPSNGVLHAYDAGNLANEFYNSNLAGTRDTLGLASKFSIPLVANGKVFVGAQNHLVVYGLLP